MGGLRLNSADGLPCCIGMQYGSFYFARCEGTGEAVLNDKPWHLEHTLGPIGVIHFSQVQRQTDYTRDHLKRADKCWKRSTIAMPSHIRIMAHTVRAAHGTRRRLSLGTHV